MGKAVCSVMLIAMSALSLKTARREILPHARKRVGRSHHVNPDRSRAKRTAPRNFASGHLVYIMNNPLSGRDPSGYFTCDEKGTCTGTVGEIEKIDVYKDGTITATNKDGQTIEIGKVGDKKAGSTMNAFILDSLGGATNGFEGIQGTKGLMTQSADQIESTSHRALMHSSVLSTPRGDAKSGAVFALGTTLSLGIGSLLLSESDKADIAAFEERYGASAAVLGIAASLRNPAQAFKNVWKKADDALSGVTKKLPHGNKIDDRPATLYEKFDKDGNFRKHGITKHDDPTKRYSRSQIDGGTVVRTDRGPRSEMIKRERDLVERRPGPDNHEPWAGRRSEE
jgi:hypothetical protein